MPAFRILALFAVFALFAAPSQAFAQADAGCPTPERFDGPVEVFPADGASGVALNEPLRVRYSAGSLDSVAGAPEALLTVQNSDTGTPIAGAVSILGDTLAFVPTGGWPEGTVVVGVARGVDADLDIQFITGSVVDEHAPEILGALEMDSSAVPESCTSPDGFRVDITFPRATDLDGARGDIEYLLYITRGPDIDVPILVSRARNFASDDITMAFVLDGETVSGPICTAVLAVDGAGHSSSSREVCGNPLDGAFFQPLCDTTAPGRPASIGSWLVVLCLLGTSFAVRRVHRRRHHNG